MSEYFNRQVDKLLKEAEEKCGPCPEECPECGSALLESSGFVGEKIVYCNNDKCKMGVVWEDTVGAIRRVI